MLTRFDGLDEAIIGVGARSYGTPALVYDYMRIVNIFVQGGMSLDEATEYVDFNVVGVNLGDDTPIIMTQMSVEDIEENIDAIS